MKTDREYPATHSMSTAWYIVDDEGNVGILDYNENGPVPHAIPEEDIECLVWGLWDDNKKYKHVTIQLTRDQIYENLSKPYPPSEEKLWFQCVVRIDINKRERFLQLANKVSECICISEEEGLYIFDAFRCKDDSDAIIKDSALDIMLKENLIIENYRIPMFDNDDTFNNETNVPEHTKNYESCSYFIYHQPYWEEYLPQKMSKPQFPVKISQLPDELKDKVHKIPGNFNDLETFQIAEFYPSYTTHSLIDPIYLIDGNEYELLPLPDGSKAYLLSEEQPANNAKSKVSLEEFEKLKEIGRAIIKERRGI